MVTKVQTTGFAPGRTGATETTHEFGHRFCLYGTLARGPVTADELAQAAGLTRHTTRLWLAAHRAAGEVVTDPDSGRNALSWQTPAN